MAFLTRRFPGVTRDRVRHGLSSKSAVRVGGDASLDVASVVSDVSVLCPRTGVLADNKSAETSGAGCSATWPRNHRDGPLVEDAADYFLLT